MVQTTKYVFRVCVLQRIGLGGLWLTVRERDAKARELYRYRKEQDARAEEMEKKKKRADLVNRRAAKWKADKETSEARRREEREEAEREKAESAKFAEGILRRELRLRAAAALAAKREKEEEERVMEEARELLRANRDRPAEQPIEKEVYARLCRHANNNGKEQTEARIVSAIHTATCIKPKPPSSRLVFFFIVFFLSFC